MKKLTQKIINLEEELHKALLEYLRPILDDPTKFVYVRVPIPRGEVYDTTYVRDRMVFQKDPSNVFQIELRKNGKIGKIIRSVVVENVWERLESDFDLAYAFFRQRHY